MKFVTSDIFVCLLEKFAFVSSLFKFDGWYLLLRNVLFLKMVFKKGVVYIVLSHDVESEIVIKPYI